MKKILIIHTGGTFGMSPVQPSKTLRPGNIAEEIAFYLPILNQIAEIEIKIAFNLDSSNIGPAQWVEIYQIIATHLEVFDGFVVIHGTDTLVYTAAAMSFLLNKCNKPIIFTGAQRPLSAVRSDARSNLINAVELATKEIPEVCICFDNNLYRGNRTKKLSIESYHGFESPNHPALAKLGLNIQLNKEYFLTRKNNITLQPKFKTDIMVIPIFPGMDYKPYIRILEDEISAVILSGFGAGNVPEDNPDWIQFIDYATASKKLVFISSQSPHGTVDLDLYECGRKALEAGAVSLKDMTLEAALVKLMLCNGNFQDRIKIKRMMPVPIAGEVTVTEQ